MPSLSIILPAKNEAAALPGTLQALKATLPEAEIIVVSDGSTDSTAAICKEHGISVISHPYSMGNGAAVKSGARAAGGDVLVFMDADGQHDPGDIPELLAKLNDGFDMVVGARDAASQASFGRLCANGLYNRLSSWMTGQRIIDLTSGFRVVRTQKFCEFLRLLPNGFSYPTTITMAFFKVGYAVGYVPIQARARRGKSHIRPVLDGARFLMIIFKIGTLYSPLKLFLPISLAHFLLGTGYYLYTYLSSDRFTNMSALLISISIVIFLIGLVSEQITSLLYSDRERSNDPRQKY